MQARRKLEGFLARSFAAPVVTEKDGKIHLFAQKGAYARFSVYITHLSILIIFAGAILGSLWGFKGYVNIPEGQQVSQVWPRNGNTPIDLGFAVRCDSFAVSFYPGTARPKEFKSVLTILRNGKPVPGLDHHPIIVNKPLTYKGITFYQSGYGPSGSPTLGLQVKARATGKTRQVSIEKGEQVPLSGGAQLRLVDFTSSFQNYGPAAKLEVLPPSGQPRSFVILKNFPDFDAQRGGDYIISLTDFQQHYFTGLQVAKDPGVWVVWLGCLFLVLGQHQRLLPLPPAHLGHHPAGGEKDRNQDRRHRPSQPAGLRAVLRRVQKEPQIRDDFLRPLVWSLPGEFTP